MHMLSDELKELGAQVLDADAMAKELQEPGQPGYRAILGAFGPDFLLEDGRLDRKKLAREVFSHEDSLKKANPSPRSGLVPARKW